MDNTNKKRVVLDTNQIIAAGSNWLSSLPRTPITPVQHFMHCVLSKHTALYSSAIAGEYFEILIRRKHPKERIKEYVGCFLETFELVEVHSKKCSPIPSDPDDVKFILCALDGKANYLVTDDKALLKVKEGYRQLAIVRREEVEQYFQS